MRLLKTFSFFSFLLLLSSCYEPERNCAKFRTGKFQFETFINGELEKTTFIRNDSIEIDFYKGETDTSSVRWINDCEYILTNLHPKNMAQRKPLHIKILTTDGNSYNFEYGLVGESEKQKGTVYKIEE